MKERLRRGCVEIEEEGVGGERERWCLDSCGVASVEIYPIEFVAVGPGSSTGSVYWERLPAHFEEKQPLQVGQLRYEVRSVFELAESDHPQVEPCNSS